MKPPRLFYVAVLVVSIAASASAGVTKADKMRLEQLEARSGDSKQAMEAFTSEQERLGIVANVPSPKAPSSVDLINESFEGTFPPAGWTSVIVTGDSAWRYSTSGPHTGVGNANGRFNPSTSPPGSKFLTTPRVTVSGSSSYTLSFWIRRAFSSVFPPDTVYVKISTTDSLPASFTTTLYKCYTGSNTSTDPNIYTTTHKQFSTVISGYSGDIFLAFDHQDDDGQTLYLDDVVLTENLTNDMSAFSLDDPANGGSKSPNTPFAPVATFKNTGGSPQSAVTVRYQILDNTPSVVYTNNQTTGALAAGATEQIIFASASEGGGLAAGVYTIRAITLLGGDGNSSNDTLSGTLTVAPNIADYAYFASSGTFTPLSGSTAPVLSGGSLDDGWYNDVPIGFTFSYNSVDYTDLAASTNGWLALGQSSVTTSATTNSLTSGGTTIGAGATNACPILGPLWDDIEVDTAGLAGQFSYKTEQVAGPEGVDSVFTGEWLYMKWPYTAAAANISFQVKLYKSGRVEFIYQQEAGAFTSGGASIGITDNNTGTDHFISLDGTGTSPARSSSTESAALTGRPATGQMYTFGPPAANDVTALSLDVPANGGALPENTSFAPKATFKNVGTADQVSSFNVKYEILNAVPAVVYTNTQAVSSLTSGASTQVTFASTSEGGGLAAGTYTIRAISQLGGDANPLNDTLSGTLTVLTVISSFPYSEDFEDPAPETGGAGWYTGVASGAANDWVRATPAKTYLSGAHGGLKCYVTKDTGDYNSSQNSFLATPVLNLSSLANDASVSFWHKFILEVGWDAGILEYTTDGGTTWRRADSTLGTGPDYNTANSASWYNNSGTNGPIIPPKWSDTSGTDYAGNAGGWINSTTTLPGTVGLSDVRLRWRFGSDGSVAREGWAIDDVTIDEGTGSVNVSVGIDLGWNLVSNPVVAANDSVSALYPNSLFDYGFSFGSTGYSQDYTMENGPGFWAKFPAAEVNQVSGLTRAVDTVAVQAGWNILGSLSSDIDTGLVDDPGAIRSSVWFGYSSGYFTASTIEAGKGYWVKASAPGNFIFSTTLARPHLNGVNPLEGLSVLTITDASGAKQVLYFGVDNGRIAPDFYAMPPLPPSGAFDARFLADAMVQTHGAGAIASMPVALREVVLPVTVEWNIADGAVYELSNGHENRQTMRGTGQTTFGQEVSALIIRSTGADGLPKEFALYQNYPNPFNPSTNIRFALPVQSRVSVEIFNALGQRVKVLTNDQLPAGFHVVEWNGTGSTGNLLGSGVYFVRLSATGMDAKSFSDIRKLMLLK